MSDKTQISWTDATWNPIYGCSRVSKGCERCYAEEVVAALPRKFKERNPEAFNFYSGLTKDTPNGPRWTGVVKVHEGHLLQPLRWTESRRIFVNSLSDLFHERLSISDIARVFAVMASAPKHTFQVLTKRPRIMQELLSDPSFKESVRTRPGGLAERCHTDWQIPWPLPNVWLGVSVEDQRAADERIPLLLQTPAAVRFLSCEPLLGPIQFPSLQGIGWAIVGGESGPSFRPMDYKWAQSIWDQCKAAKVAFFYKQDAARKAGQLQYPVETYEEFGARQFPGEVAR